tara:strand:+ start:2966 stop:3904 length:939 start_codon:yes stop_codon:yes gene_type:complete
MKGVVVKSTGNLLKVLSINKQVYLCKIKGKTRLMNIDFTNPIAVGDNVEFSYDQKNKIGLIEKIENRKNYIIRKSVNLSHKSQLIASNIDLALLIVTLDNPITSLAFIDRFLVTSEAYGIDVRLVFNKIDLYNNTLRKKHDIYQKIYLNIGYKCLSISALSSHSKEDLQNLLKDKVSVLTGHSGVGKSTIVNLVSPGYNIKTQDLSEYHNQGVHTTTYAQMYSLNFGGSIIDTPGIKGLGLIDLDSRDLSGYFPEMALLKSQCKFQDCMHINEPECAIIQALENGNLPASRHRNYLSMLEKNTNYRKNDYQK